MEHTLNTLEGMLRVAAECGGRHAAVDTALSIVRSMSGQEVEVLREQLAERRGWCGKPLDHKVRTTLSTVAALVTAERELIA